MGLPVKPIKRPFVKSQNVSASLNIISPSINAHFLNYIESAHRIITKK